MPPKKPTMKTVYHEKQVELYCGKHAMNALLGEEKFVQEHGNTSVNIDDKINIYGICREQHETLAKELADLDAETPMNPEVLDDMIAAMDVETHIPCEEDGNFVSATLTMCLKRLGFAVGRDDAEGTAPGYDQEPFFTLDDVYTYVDKYDGNPNLLGYMVNIGGWHWIAVSARVGCPDGETPYFVIDSMKKKSWYIKNCSDAEALKKFFTKAINEANGKEGEDAFGQTQSLRGAVLAVLKTPESYSCAICGGDAAEGGAAAALDAELIELKELGGKRKSKRRSRRHLHRQHRNKRRTQRRKRRSANKKRN